MNECGLSLENDDRLPQQHQQQINSKLLDIENNCDNANNNNNCKNNNFIDSTIKNNLNFLKIENIVKDDFIITKTHYDVSKHDLSNLNNPTNTIGNAFCGDSNDGNSFTTNNCQRYPSTALGYYSQSIPQQPQQQQYPQQLNYSYSTQQFNINNGIKSSISTNNWIKTDECSIKNSSTQNDYQQYQLMDQAHQFGSCKV